MNVKAILYTLATVVAALAVVHYVAPASIKQHLGIT
jgi:hypothetical protein